MDVVSDACFVKIDLGEHKVAREDQTFGGVAAALFDSEPQPPVLAAGNQHNRIDQAAQSNLP